VSSGLTLSVERANGMTVRWGPDELDAVDIPTGLSFGTSIPGGFKDLSCELLRRIDLDYDDQTLFDTVKVLGPGNIVVWEGRMHAFPRSHGDGPSITPQAVGWNAHLKDDPSFSIIYIDRDLSGWQGASRARRIVHLTAGRTVGDPATAPDPTSTLTALQLTLTGPWATAAVVEAWYDAGPGNLVSNVYWDRTSHSEAASQPSATFEFYAGYSNDDNNPFVQTADLHTTTADTEAQSNAASSAARFAYFRWQHSAVNAAASEYTSFLRRLAVYGTHGLTGAGTAPDDGFYASDIVAHIVSTAAPMLTYSTGADGSIEPTSFVIPHLVFRDPTTAEDAIMATNAFHLYEWGVWEDREFFFRQPES
jgi:hypothetical protein